MTTKPNDGGHAFPHQFDGWHGGATHGMSLRDWFAGQALAGIASISNEGFSLSPQDEAAWAYERADAMLKAREEMKDD